MASTTICEWPACLYYDKKRTWKYGTLAIRPFEIQFMPDDTDETNQSSVSIPYGDINDIKKTRTGLVFGAIYIVTKTKKLWFSSLPDRNGIYSALTHFWKAQLLLREGGSRASYKSSQTKMGQKLLSIVQDSEDTLVKAADRFYNQGRQLDHALNTMDDIHNDLDIAENLVGDLESWFGRWRLPEQYQTVDPVFVDKSEIADVFEFEIIFTKVETNRPNLRQVGSMRISKDGISIVNLNMKIAHHYRWANVSEIRVLTPWEIMIVRRHIGEPDLKYSVIGANMAAALKLFDKCARYKLKYDSPPERILCTNHMGERSDPHSRSARNTVQEEARGLATNRMADDQPQTVPLNLSMGVDQIQVNQSEQIVSEREAIEISRRLENLKSLAIGVQVEGNDQSEKIDSLTTAVDRANFRLQDNQRRIKKMT